MTIELPLTEVLATAKHKLSSASTCLNDSTAFNAAVAEFDEWLAEHKDFILANSSEESTVRHDIERLIRQLARLELQANYNLSLVSDMQSYIQGKLEHATTPKNPYHR